MMMKAWWVCFIVCSFPAATRSQDATPAVLKSVLGRGKGLVDADSSLGRMLLAVVVSQMKGCDLVTICNGMYCRSSVLRIIHNLSNAKQVLKANSVEDFLRVNWVSPKCRGYLMLLEEPQPLLTLAASRPDVWDYSGRYLVLGRSLADLEALTATRNGKKTENLAGAVQTGHDKAWRLYTGRLYWGPGMLPVTAWRGNTFTKLPRIFPDKVSNLRGAVLKVSTFQFEPSIMYYTDEHGDLLYRYGEDISLTQAIAGALNFTPSFAEPADGETWGYELANGSWVGVMGEIQRDEADIVVSNLYVSLARVGALDYTAPYKTEMTCFLARTAPPLPRWQALAFPFHQWTWLAILIGLIVSGPVLFLLACASDKVGSEVANLAQLSFSWYYTFGLHFCEAQKAMPNMASTRTFVIFLWLYTMVLTIGYSTNLTAFLLVRKAPTAIETIKDLYGSGLEVAAIGDIYKAGIASASDPHLRGLLRVFKGYPSEREIVPRVLQGKAVFLQSRSFSEFHVITRYTTLGVPRMRFMKECFAPYSIAMALQRHSPLKRKFDEVINWVVESGLLRRFFVDSLRLAATTKEYGGIKGEPQPQDTGMALNMDHMQSIFLLTVLGWASGLIFFLFENVNLICRSKSI